MNNPRATIAPVIETQRTILRAHRLGDFDAYAVMWTDPVVTRFIGEAGFHDLKRDIQPSIEGIPEAGWALAPAIHGAGFATEVVGRVLAWGEETFGSARTVCIIDPENAASLNVATKCGYREVVRTTYHDAPTILLERLP
ncbi:GNAT family N-acetyltransferase [Mesorhizobium sophorae]|uniref:GNAT family N-acetyltransferase n=1 Tax=Mesorhizobium sophorae TaxID=1300294 RepID=UPI000BA4E519|nr:GNAT family N-acetyltransferase [Mesorhizobium sophorae]